MKRVDPRVDPIADLYMRDTPSAEIVPDEAGNIIYFAEDELERINDYIGRELDDAIKFSKNRWDRALANYRVYEGENESGESLADGDLVVTIAKRDANQIISWMVQTMLGRKPYASAIPHDYGTVQVVVPHDQFGQVMTEASVEEVADGLSTLLNYYLEHKLNYREILTTIVTDCVIGMAPAILKVCYDYDEYETSVGGFEQTGSPFEEDGKIYTPVILDPRKRKIEMTGGSEYKILPISTLNWVMPNGCDDIQSAPWVAERIPRITPMDMRIGISSGKYTLGKQRPLTSEEVERIVYGRPPDDSEAPFGQMLKDRESDKPAEDQDTFEVWLTWPVLIGIDPETDEPNIVVAEIFTHYHYSARAGLFFRENPYIHKKRPFVATFFRKRPHQFSSSSIVEDVLPYQKLVTSLFKLQIQNGVQATLKAFLVRRGSEAHQCLIRASDEGGIKPGDFITFVSREEIEPFQTGGSLGTLKDEIQFANDEAQRLTGVNEIDRGFVPDRTAEATIKRIHEQSKMQASMALESIRYSMSEVFTMFLQMLQQYAPSGRQIPVYDPRKRAIIDATIAMPVDMIEDQFSFTVTATSEDQTREAEVERETAAYTLIEKDTKFLIEAVPTMLGPSVPPVFQEFLKFLVNRDQDHLKRVLGTYRKDADLSVLNPEEVDSLLNMARQAQISAQQTAVAAQGAQSSGPPPPPGGPNATRRQSGPGGVTPPGPGGPQVPPGAGPPSPPQPGGAVPEAGVPGPGGGGPPQEPGI